MGFKEEMENLLPETLIHNVTFDHQEGVVEITFADLADQAEGVGMIKTAALERELFYSEVEDLEAHLRNMISEVQVSIRNDDARQLRIKRANDRFKGGSLEDDDEDED